MLPDITSQKVAIPAALFLSLSPGLLLTTDGSKRSFHEPKDQSDGGIFPRTRILPRVQPHCQGNGSRTHKDRLTRDHRSLYATKPRSLTHPPPRSGGVFGSGQTSIESAAHTRSRVRSSICDFTSSISSILLSKKMKYLVLGPASMGIFSLIGD